MDDDAIVARRMRAQRLWSAGAPDPHAAVRHMLAVQAQELPYALWSVGQRTARPGLAAVTDAFDRGLFLRTHVLRPTWHFVARDDLRWLMRLSGPRVAARTARRNEELGLDPRTVARALDVIAGAVAGAHRTRRELAAALKRRRIDPEGQRIAHLVIRAELDSIVCSGALRGTEHTYAAFDGRVPARAGPSGDEALAELAHRYVRARGPATAKDLVWWAGLSMRDATRALSIVEPNLERVERDGRTYWMDSQPRGSRASAPRIDLVQCYDEIIISYTQSRDALWSAGARFPVPGTIEGFRHVVLRDGRLLGHWRAVRGRTGVSLETRIGGRLDPTTRKALEVALERYRRFLAG